jgi:tetratricopeptide (TPR) repeat protein
LKLKARKRYAQARELLRTLAAEYVNSASVFGLLGDVNWRLGELSDAVRCFGRATSLSPTSELASLGLFHSLWDAGRIEAALNEMQRFLSLSRSAEYARLLRELIRPPKLNGKRTAGKTGRSREKHVAVRKRG